MKIYTKTGDDGTTGLFNGQRVGKDHRRVASYGDVDELNSLLGLAIVACDDSDSMGGPLRESLLTIQSHLFDLGADLATPQLDPMPTELPGDGDDPETKQSAKSQALESRTRRITPAHYEQLERWIDQASEPLPPLRQFILPGGSELAARLHVARSVCRRAERQCVTLTQLETVNPAAMIYLNRLSDLLFAYARWANHLTGQPDVPWQQNDP